MIVNNAATAQEYVRDWLRAGERSDGLAQRANVGRFRRTAQDQRGCARLCAAYGRVESAAGHEAAAAVIEAAAKQAEQLADAAEAAYERKQAEQRERAEDAMKAAAKRFAQGRIS